MNVLRELLEGLCDLIPGMKLFYKSLKNEQELQKEYLNYISAVECGLMYGRGVVLVT